MRYFTDFFRLWCNEKQHFINYVMILKFYQINGMIVSTSIFIFFNFSFFIFPWHFINRLFLWRLKFFEWTIFFVSILSVVLLILIALTSLSLLRFFCKMANYIMKLSTNLIPLSENKSFVSINVCVYYITLTYAWFMCV
jgi:hypothetical protein